MKLHCVKSFSLIHKVLGSIYHKPGDDFELNDEAYANMLIKAGLVNEIVEVVDKISKKRKQEVVEVEPEVEIITEVNVDGLSSE